MGPNEISWILLSTGVAVIGILLSWLAWRRRGAASGLRGIAWSLVPPAAALTGVAEMLWQLGTAASKWVAGFVFNPMAWAGVIVAGLAVVLYVVSGLLRRRGGGDPAARGGSTASTPAAKGSQPARKKVEQRRPDPADPDLSEIEDILKRRGIS